MAARQAAGGPSTCPLPVLICFPTLFHSTFRKKEEGATSKTKDPLEYDSRSLPLALTKNNSFGYVLFKTLMLPFHAVVKTDPQLNKIWSMSYKTIVTCVTRRGFTEIVAG